MVKSKMMAAVLAATALSMVGSVANAATGLAFANLDGAEYDTAGVYLRGDVLFTGTTDDGTGFDLVQFRLFDDGVVKFSQTFNGIIGSANSFHFEAYYPGLVAQGAQGVGLVLDDLPSEFTVTIDPYNIPHYKDPSECQRACGPGAVPEPSSWLMLVAGFGVLGGALRSRRADVTATITA